MIEKSEFFTVMRKTALILKRYAPDLQNSEEVLMWYDHLKTYDLQRFSDVMTGFHTSQREFPSLFDIRKKLEGVDEPDVIAAKLWAALSSPPSRKTLDPVCQETIRICGGWNSYRETLESEKASVMKTWRGVAAEVNKKMVTGGLKSVPMLEDTENNKALTAALDIINGGVEK